MDGIPEKQISVSLQYVEEKLIVSPDCWKAASNGAQAISLPVR